MISQKDILYARERRRDALALAERERLARQVLAQRTPRPRFVMSERYHLWLAQLGARMVRWGEHLQARYAPAPMSAQASTK